MYSIYTSLSSIFKQKSVYITTTLFTLIGFLIAFVILTMFFNEYNFIKDALRNTSLNDVEIDVSYKQTSSYDELTEFEVSERVAGVFSADESIVTPQDINYIKENFKDKLDFKVMMFKNFHMPYGDTMSFQQFMYFISDDYMDFFRKQANVSGDCIVASKKTIEKIKQAHIQGLRTDIYYNTRQFPVFYDPELDVFTDLNREKEIPVIFFDDMTDLDKFDKFYTESALFQSMIAVKEMDIWENYIFVSLNLYYDVYHPFDNLLFNIRVTPTDINALSELLYYLNVAHQGQATYSYTSVIDRFLAQIKEQVSFLAILTPLTVIILLVVSMNFTGLQIMSIQKERKNIAIRIACGATMKAILFGYLLKSFVCMMSSVLIAIPLGILFIYNYEFNMFKITITPSWEATVCIIALASLISILSVLPTLLKVSKLSPSIVLSEEANS